VAGTSVVAKSEGVNSGRQCFAEYSLLYRALLQKKPILLSILLRAKVLTADESEREREVPRVQGGRERARKSWPEQGRQSEKAGKCAANWIWGGYG